VEGKGYFNPSGKSSKIDVNPKPEVRSQNVADKAAPGNANKDGDNRIFALMILNSGFLFRYFLAD
jgi:hypothetical protein